MSFVKRDYSTAQPEIPECAQKEAELIFHLIINIDQTPLKFAPVSSSQTMATKNFKHVHVTGFSYEQAITGIFLWHLVI